MKQLARYGLILAGICLGRLLPLQAQVAQPAQDSATVIHILRSDKLNVVTRDSVQLNRFIGNAAFRQGSTLFYCDSALINRAANVLDAYGHIHINQADSIHIYGDYLHYEGNTRIATLVGNARLTDSKVTITGPELQYDMNARIGTYTKTGKLVNGSSVLTSQEGFYYADTRDVYFKKNVLLVDPEYTLTTDTLLYNTDTRIATIVAPTTINDNGTIMYATSGYYNTETGYGSFGSRPTIEDSTATITADNIEMDKRTGLAYATGNMVYRDTAQKISLLSNYGTVNQAEKTVLATQHPLMILERGTDTLYMTADTLFSGILKRDTLGVLQPPRMPGAARSRDTLRQADTSGLPEDGPPQEEDTTGLEQEAVPDQPEEQTARLPKDALRTQAKDTTQPKAPGQPRTPIASLPKDPLRTPSKDSAHSKAPRQPGEPVARLPKDSLPSPARDTPTATRNTTDPLTAPVPPPPDTMVAAQDTTEYRYILAYHHVRIYSDSLQGVADSVFYSARDSIFRFFRNPVMWANNTQLIGDTIFLYTKNQQADRILLNQNALIVNEAGPELYNQVKGNTITGYFNNKSLDWMHVDGNAESIYYVKDEDSAFISVNRSLSGIINIYFRTGELYKVAFVKDPEGTMYPFTQRPMDQMLLENFHWYIDRKPKSKYELMGNSVEKRKPENDGETRQRAIDGTTAGEH